MFETFPMERVRVPPHLLGEESCAKRKREKTVQWIFQIIILNKAGEPDPFQVSNIKPSGLLTPGVSRQFS